MFLEHLGSNCVSFQEHSSFAFHEARDDWPLGIQSYQTLSFTDPRRSVKSLSNRFLIAFLFRQRGGCVQRQAVHHGGDQACTPSQTCVLKAFSSFLYG